jgi:hypothetical protein
MDITAIKYIMDITDSTVFNVITKIMIIKDITNNSRTLNYYLSLQACLYSTCIRSTPTARQETTTKSSRKNGYPSSIPTGQNNRGGHFLFEDKHHFYIFEWSQKAECRLFERISPSPWIFVTVFGLHCLLFKFSEILIICQAVGFVVRLNAANVLTDKKSD